MARSFLQIENLSYRWPAQVENLFHSLSFSLDAGWTGLVGENGSGKSTLLSLIAGSPAPDSGRIRSPGGVVLCEQRTDSVPEFFEEFASLPDAAAGRLASELDIESDWPWRWDTLSHGERKRAQIATALWRNPGVLLADEPANHLDEASRRLLADALSRYRGIGVIVAHDRRMLDFLCDRTLFLGPSGAVLRPGGVSAGLEEMEKEALAARREREEARKDLKRIEAEARRRSRKAAAADRLRSKRDLAPGDHDGRFRNNVARLTGKDGRAGRLKSQMDDRLERARVRLETAAVEPRKEGGISLEAVVSRSDFLVRLPSGSENLGNGRRLKWPDLTMKPADRIALTGPNGAGKSRLFIRLTAMAGEEALVIPQEIAAGEGSRIAEAVRGLPRNEKGEVFSAVDRLGSDPRRLMETASPSPGETRKLLLALGLARRPAWIAMDEPTNHMDLFSIRHLEAALAGYGGALFLVSHDRRFLDALTRMEWSIGPSADDPAAWMVNNA